MTDLEKQMLKDFCNLNSFICKEDRDGWIHITMPIPAINNRKFRSSRSIHFTKLQIEEKSLKQITGWMKESYCNAIWNTFDVPDEGVDEL